jgi:hypothetical protein
MNTNGVAKYYGALSAEERFRMLLAASARGDELEIDRLHRSAKRLHFSVHDTTGYLLGTSEAIMWLMTQRLKLALCMTETLFHAAEMDWYRPRRKKNDDTEMADRTHKTACMFAYLLKVHAEAARLFVDETGASALQQCGTSPMEPLKPDPFLIRAEETAGHLAISADEMKNRLQEHAGPEVQVKSTESILLEARGIRDFFVKQWS